MTTKRRQWVEGGVYHITARGNHRNDIFRDEEDFQVYLTLIEESFFRYGNLNYKLASYCLMDNHVHLMIKVDTQPVGILISRVHSIYTRYFNKKYNYIGHLFQDRYFSELIEDDKQMLATSRYIHLNPIRAKMVEVPQEYKWSSYSMLIGEEVEKLIDSNIILNYFKNERRYELYKAFVEAKMKKVLKEEEETA